MIARSLWYAMNSVPVPSSALEPSVYMVSSI
jgi:hypothetical protein